MHRNRRLKDVRGRQMAGEQQVPVARTHAADARGTRMRRPQGPSRLIISVLAACVSTVAAQHTRVEDTRQATDVVMRTAEVVPANRVIDFPARQFSAYVFTAQTSVYWTVATPEAATVTRLDLIRSKAGDTIAYRAASESDVVPAATLTSSDGDIAQSTGLPPSTNDSGVDTSLLDPRQVHRTPTGEPDDGPLLLENVDLAASGSVALAVERLASSDKEQMLYFQLKWHDAAGNDSISYSCVFALHDRSDGPTYRQLEEDISAKGHAPAFPEGHFRHSSGISALTSLPPTGTTSTGPLQPGTTAAGETSDQKKEEAGLSTGASAGIAVACAVLGLAAIAAAVSCLCLRWRRKDRSVASYGSDSGTGILHDKSLPVVSGESPKSPYAADGMSLQDPDSAAVANMDDTAASYSRYSDRAVTPSSLVRSPIQPNGAGITMSRSRHQIDVGAPARALSPMPPIAPRYSHLVEEGMTADEIRRLEEEERHLDAAIEDASAGRASRRASAIP